MHCISCIMPTYNRGEWLPAAIDSFLNQTFAQKELIILDDSDESAPQADIFPLPPAVRYFRIGSRLRIGAKRNQCCRMARGDIIAHFDDDDWSAPGRLQDQLERLLKKKKPIVGYGSVIFWNIQTRKATKFQRTDGYVCGTSLFYLKSFWRSHQFNESKIHGEDNEFIYTNFKHVSSSSREDMMIARIHGQHTSTKENIIEEIPREQIPAAFWANERIRAHGQ